MKNILTLIAAFLLTFSVVANDSLFTVSGPAETVIENTSVTVNTEVKSEYFFRGIRQDGTANQTALDINQQINDAISVTGSVWSNVPLDNESTDLTEFDYALQLNYTNDLGTLSVGTTRYTGAGVEETTEIFGQLSGNFFLNPTLTYAYDVEENENCSFIDLQFDHNVAGLNLAVDFPFQNNSENYEENVLPYVEFTASYELELDEIAGFTFVPSVTAIVPNDDEANFDQTTEFVYGINILRNF